MKTKPTNPGTSGRPGTNQAPIQFNEDHAVIDSRMIADGIDVMHKNLMKRILYHQALIEKSCGPVQYETKNYKTNGGSQLVKYALLTEEQAVLLLLLTKKKPEGGALKLASRLIQSIREAQKPFVLPLPRRETWFETLKALAESVCLAVIHGQFRMAINVMSEAWTKVRGANLTGCNQGGMRG